MSKTPTGMSWERSLPTSCSWAAISNYINFRYSLDNRHFSQNRSVRTEYRANRDYATSSTDHVLSTLSEQLRRLKTGAYVSPVEPLAIKKALLLFTKGFMAIGDDSLNSFAVRIYIQRALSVLTRRGKLRLVVKF